MQLDTKRTGGRISADEALALWQRYRDSGDRAVRDRLVLTFAPMVKYIVYKKVKEIPARCEVDDFISCGLEALIKSIDRYDPAKGATLEQFAWTRIHGAVLDELRRQDWAPRSLRRWERDINKAREQFTAVHGRRPSEDELAEALATTVEDLRTRMKEGDAVSAMIINVDRKNRSINLSIKAKENADESEAMQRVTADTSGANTGTTNLGALLKAKLDTKNNG